MCDDSVTSEIWQDQFLECLSSDIFSEDDDCLDCHVTDSIEKPASKIITTFVAEKEAASTSPDNHVEFEFINKELRFEIECLRSTSVEMVGLQVWRGALLLADYILTHPAEFAGKRVLELAAGTGITSIAVAQLAQHVLCTDVDRGEILSTIRKNFELNHDLLRCDVNVDEIDFFDVSWRSTLSTFVDRVDVIIVADVVYNPELTQKFFSSLAHIVDRAERELNIYFSIEKRNRVVESGQVAAPNFDLFVGLLGEFSVDHQCQLSTVEIDFPQRFKCYDRVQDLFMWKLSLSLHQ